MSDTHWWFLDQAAVIAITGVLTFGVFAGASGVTRIVLTAPLVLFLPGYALVSALFPDEPNDDYQSFDEGKTGLVNPLLVSGGLEPVERFILSIVFSVSLVPAITLFSGVTPWGLTVKTVLSGLAVLTVILALVAISSRYRCSPDQRFTPSVSVPSVTRSRSTLYERTNRRPYSVAVAIGVGLLVASAGFAVANPPQHDGFTEFSVETENVTGETETMYESTYDVGESRELETTISNHEHEERTYTTVVLLERVSYGDDEVTVQEADELERKTTTVPDGTTHRQTLEVTPTMEGEQLRLTLLLYDDEPPEEPTAENAYRVVSLPIEAT
ncbi:DUF1616 domain-containing protein [Natrialbaceae archaeon AArc-T1-2]|uniref:DUF1616 domain-containing protein n=1 Tax=Natrialbaceae archaeon AArc-T1-2 TaxID=3053904 RepID=UPI00255ABB11|nr:DUF1616 domain-containing protein [Natrialbaceae archaeon AArc-T1-2]WIV67422.1 DUF1616 domain-containing protein [Natrialbaceae archaeon AArc-T1-2]